MTGLLCFAWLIGASWTRGAVRFGPCWWIRSLRVRVVGANEDRRGWLPSAFFLPFKSNCNVTKEQVPASYFALRSWLGSWSWVILSPKDALWRAEGAILLKGQTSTPSIRRQAGWGLEACKCKNTQLRRQDDHWKKKCCSAPVQRPSPTSNTSAVWVPDLGLSNSFQWNVIARVQTATKPEALPLLLMNLLGVLKPLWTELGRCSVKCFWYLNKSRISRRVRSFPFTPGIALWDPTAPALHEMNCTLKKANPFSLH